MITLLTDFGTNSIYATQAKVWLKSRLPQVEVVDITHNIHACDINEAAYVLELLISEFPADSIHIVAIDFDERYNHQEIIHFKWKGQHVLTYNSGFASLFLVDYPDLQIKQVRSYEGWHVSSVSNAFGPIAQELQRRPKSDKNYQIADKLYMKTALQPVSNQDSLHGHVVYFDARGTAHTNISKHDFDDFVKEGRFSIVLSRHERISTVTKKLQHREGGSPICYFNSAGYLAIEIHRGQTSKMYGMNRGHLVIIERT